MLFTSHVIKSLTEDHKKLRQEIKVLKDNEVLFTEKRQAFGRLLPHLVSHNKKEKVVYSFMKLTDEDDLRIWAVEGKEEHQLVDHLVKKMLNEEISIDEWTTKAKVLAELLDHHITEEEESIFPNLNSELDEESDAELFQKYQNASERPGNYSDNQGLNS